MKRILFIIATLALLVACSKDKDKESSGKPGEPAVEVHPVAVDLGLSVKWASFNVGATKPSGLGDLFAWGEVEPKETYDWITYKWALDDRNKLTKYCYSDRPNRWGLESDPDGITVLDPEDDAARAILGGEWRMPSQEELAELVDSCTWVSATKDNVAGYLIQNKNSRYKDSIFIPSAGYQDDSSEPGKGRIGVGDFLNIWSSTLEHGSCAAYCIYLRAQSENNPNPEPEVAYIFRHTGFPIRAVCK